MAQIEIKIKQPIPSVTLSPQDKAEALGEIEELYDWRVFRDDLRYLRRVGKVKMTEIAGGLDVWPQNVYRWMAGKNCPRNPYPMVLVRMWANRLREAIEAQEREV